MEAATTPSGSDTSSSPSVTFRASTGGGTCSSSSARTPSLREWRTPRSFAHTPRPFWLGRRSERNPTASRKRGRCGSLTRISGCGIRLSIITSLAEANAIQPDHELVPTWADYRVGRDPVLEWILHYASSSGVVDRKKPSGDRESPPNKRLKLAGAHK